MLTNISTLGRLSDAATLKCQVGSVNSHMCIFPEQLYTHTIEQPTMSSAHSGTCTARRRPLLAARPSHGGDLIQSVLTPAQRSAHHQQKIQ